MVRIKIHYDLAAEKSAEEIDLNEVLRYRPGGLGGDFGFQGVGCDLDTFVKMWSYENPIFLTAKNPRPDVMYDSDRRIESSEIKFIDVLEEIVASPAIPSTEVITPEVVPAALSA